MLFNGEPASVMRGHASAEDGGDLLTTTAGPRLRFTPAATQVGTAEGKPYRFAHRIGPIKLHTAPALLALDVAACLLVFMLFRPPALVFAAQSSLTLGLFGFLHLYRRRLALNLLDDLPAMAGGTVLAHLAVYGLLTGFEPDEDRAADLYTSGALLLALTGIRLAGFSVAKRLRCRSGTQDLAVIVGAGHVGIQLGRNLRQHPEYGVEPVGYIDLNPRVTEKEQLPAPLLGSHEHLATVIQDFNVVYVMVAFGGVREEALVDILRTCDRLDVDVFVVPRLFELHNTNRHTDDIWGLPVTRVRRAAFRRPGWRAKRAMDVVLSAVALLALAPVLGACALAVRLETGPGVIFRQVRVGLDERPFDCLKFRSLQPANEEESKTQWTVKNDQRIGPVGRFLRRSSLDELPQLWNIFRGDMSLVGPRPERPHFVQQFSEHVPRYTARHRVPAGLTGWAQIHGLRGDTSIEHRAKFDNYYIENWSPWLDAKIIARTLGQVVRRAGG